MKTEFNTETYIGGGKDHSPPFRVCTPSVQIHRCVLTGQVHDCLNCLTIGNTRTAHVKSLICETDLHTNFENRTVLYICNFSQGLT